MQRRSVIEEDEDEKGDEREEDEADQRMSEEALVRIVRIERNQDVVKKNKVEVVVRVEHKEIFQSTVIVGYVDDDARSIRHDHTRVVYESIDSTCAIIGMTRSGRKRRREQEG